MPYVLGVLVIGALLAYAWSRVFRRIGWPPWLAVVAVIPLIAAVVLVVVAFSRWPLEDRVAELERELARLRGGS